MGLMAFLYLIRIISMLFAMAFVFMNVNEFYFSLCWMIYGASWFMPEMFGLTKEVRVLKEERK